MADGRTYLPGALRGGRRDPRPGRAPHGRARASSPTSGTRARGAGPARYFRLDEATAAAATRARRFGIISPMTEHFCTTCNRLRLSASGALHACLASTTPSICAARCAPAGADAVARAIRGALAGKRPGHTFQLIGLGGPRKAMVQIGG